MTSIHATVTEHRYYSSGRAFYIVQCETCLAVLNSGHHYSPEYLPNAQRLADEHNAVHHVRDEYDAATRAR